MTLVYSQNNLGIDKDTIKISDFGKNKEQTFNFTGEIFYLPQDTKRLPNFEKLTPVGKIYTQKINIKDQSFKKGFPGVTDRFEYFAIDYKGRFYIKDTCSYCFMLGSDDGSKLFIDDSLLINNDFVHGFVYKSGCRFLQKGMHKIEVQYFQGPRYNVALILRFRKKEDKAAQIFDLTEFYPITIKESGDSIHIEIGDEILFDYNSYELSEEAKQALGEIKRVLFENSKLKSIVIEGYTDDIGSDVYNLKLSKNRADEVKDLFISLGVNSETIVTRGYGKANPKFPNIDEANRKKNRRIEMLILKM